MENEPPIISALSFIPKIPSPKIFLSFLINPLPLSSIVRINFLFFSSIITSTSVALECLEIFVKDS